MRRVSIASIAPERWRNGGGLTRTVASQGGDWRVSIAEVARDGPYSRFEGIARISVVLRGHGVVLRDEAGRPSRLSPCSRPPTTERARGAHRSTMAP